MKRFLILFAFVPAIAFAYISPGKPAGFVNDFAGMLQPNEKATLETKLSAFQKTSSNEISVVTVPNLGGDTVENFAVKLFEEWGIGKKSKDNGVLLLISRDDREVRIEVGYGLEGALTDAQSYWIIQNQIIPAFKSGTYYAGIDAAVTSIMSATQGEYVPFADPQSQGGSPRVKVDWFFFIFFVPVWLASILGRSKSWWAGGVLGGIIGVILGLVNGFLYFGIISIALLIPIGLLFDYIVSKKYAERKGSGRVPPWWIGGGGFGGGSGFGGGGGFGGFGGGGSGGGGSSGKW